MRSRVGLTIVVIVVLVAIAAFIVGIRLSPGPSAVPGESGQQTTESAQPSIEQAITKLQNLTMEGAQVTQRDEAGKIVWQVSARGQFGYSEDNEVLRAEDIRWELTRPGQDSLIVEAPLFLASYPERNITFSEGVRAYTPDKSQLFEMAELIYQRDTDKLIADGRVRFRYAGYETTANRLVIDNRAHEVRMSGGVHWAPCRASGQVVSAKSGGDSL